MLGSRDERPPAPDKGEQKHHSGREGYHQASAFGIPAREKHASNDRQNRWQELECDHNIVYAALSAPLRKQSLSGHPPKADVAYEDTGLGPQAIKTAGMEAMDVREGKRSSNHVVI
jgi:hypothetical protein